jgi:hypothetical protein
MKIFRAVWSFLKLFRYGANINPVRDWLAMLTLSAILLASIIVWNIWTFDKIAAGEGSAASPVTAVFDRAPLDTLQKIFTIRAAEETKYVTGVYSYSDPSQ